MFSSSLLGRSSRDGILRRGGGDSPPQRLHPRGYKGDASPKKSRVCVFAPPKMNGRRSGLKTKAYGGEKYSSCIFCFTFAFRSNGSGTLKGKKSESVWKFFLPPSLVAFTGNFPLRRKSSVSFSRRRTDRSPGNELRPSEILPSRIPAHANARPPAEAPFTPLFSPWGSVPLPLLLYPQPPPPLLSPFSPTSKPAKKGGKKGVVSAPHTDRQTGEKKPYPSYSESRDEGGRSRKEFDNERPTNPPFPFHSIDGGLTHTRKKIEEE